MSGFLPIGSVLFDTGTYRVEIGRVKASSASFNIVERMYFVRNVQTGVVEFRLDCYPLAVKAAQEAEAAVRTLTANAVQVPSG